MDKIKESNNLNDINLLKKPNNTNNEENILTNNNMYQILYNLLNEEQIKIPNFNNFKNFMIFLDTIYTHLINEPINEGKDLTRINQILILLIEELIKQILKLNEIQINDKNELEKYFLNKNFFEAFLEVFKTIEDLTLFKDIFTKFSEVSRIYIYYNYNFVLDNTKYIKR